MKYLFFIALMAMTTTTKSNNEDVIIIFSNAAKGLTEVPNPSEEIIIPIPLEKTEKKKKFRPRAATVSEGTRPPSEAPRSQSVALTPAQIRAR